MVSIKKVPPPQPVTATYTITVDEFAAQLLKGVLWHAQTHNYDLFRKAAPEVQDAGNALMRQFEEVGLQYSHTPIIGNFISALNAQER